jgi:hypothetical protein
LCRKLEEKQTIKLANKTMRRKGVQVFNGFLNNQFTQGYHRRTENNSTTSDGHTNGEIHRSTSLINSKEANR